MNKPSDVSVAIRSSGWIATETREIILAPLDGTSDATCRAGGIFPLPGQFAHISVPGVFLRRPVSIAGYDDGLLRLLVRRAGRGTDILCSLPEGSELKALLPLGTPFPTDEIAGISKNGGHVWMVSGGIGLAPLLFLAAWAAKSGIRMDSFAGFTDEENVFGTDGLKSCGECAISVGGFVTDLVKKKLEIQRPDLIVSCGPAPMLAVLQGICREHALAAYASFEARMGCGMGACLVCNQAFETDGGTMYRRVCADGPVFNLMEAKL
jgi:dihydroorotate dehydrogenase electron transfer subunit